MFSGRLSKRVLYVTICCFLFVWFGINSLRCSLGTRFGPVHIIHMMKHESSQIEHEGMVDGSPGTKYDDQSLKDEPKGAAKVPNEGHLEYVDILANQQKLNVLFIMSDDLRPQISAYRGRYSPTPDADHQVLTPNLDGLAARSLLLTRAYNQFGVCNPSRASLMTGRRPDTTKVWTLKACWRSTGGNFTTIPQYFKDRGYITAGLGKIYHQGTSCDNDALSWTEPFYTPPHQNHWQFNRRSWEAIHEEIRKVEPLPDEETTEETIRLLRQFAPKTNTGEQRFFIGVGFHKPHVPFVCPQEMYDLYPIKSIQLANNSNLPQNFPLIAWAAPEVGRFKDMIKYNCSQKVYHESTCALPKNAVRSLRRAYFACVSYIDTLVGKLVNEIDQLGLSNSTIITFISDHGYSLGENGMVGKHSNMEQVSHTPMMISIPGRTDRGAISNSIVELVDLFPTIVDAAGFDLIQKCSNDSSEVELCHEGSSLMALIDHPDTPIKRAAFSQIGRKGTMGYTVRTTRYRYTEWPELYMDSVAEANCTVMVRYTKNWDRLKGVELYDYVSDPSELLNHADEPQYAMIRRDLRDLLHTHINSVTHINEWIDYLH